MLSDLLQLSLVQLYDITVHGHIKALLRHTVYTALAYTVYSGFPRSCNNQPSTADRKQGLCLRNVISRGMDAALRALVTARQLKSRWKEVSSIRLLLNYLRVYTIVIFYQSRQGYEHACVRRLTVQYCNISENLCNNYTELDFWSTFKYFPRAFVCVADCLFNTTLMYSSKANSHTIEDKMKFCDCSINT